MEVFLHKVAAFRVEPRGPVNRDFSLVKFTSDVPLGGCLYFVVVQPLGLPALRESVKAAGRAPSTRYRPKRWRNFLCPSKAVAYLRLVTR